MDKKLIKNVITAFFSNQNNRFYAMKFFFVFIPALMFNKSIPELYITKMVIGVNIIMAMLFDLTKCNLISLPFGIILLLFLYLVASIEDVMLYAFFALYTIWNLLFCHFYLHQVVMGLAHNFFPLCIALVSDYDLHHWLMVRCLILSYGSCNIILFDVYTIYMVQLSELNNIVVVPVV